MLTTKKSSYKWVILVVCFFMEFICLGFCSSNAGMYLTAVTQALGFERSLYTLNTSFRHLATILLSLCFGTMVKKYGTKKLICLGLVALVASTLLYSFADKLYLFYLAGALLGVGVIMTGSTMAGIVIRQWFDTDVGKYTGIAMAANGIGGAIAAQIISPIINNGDPFGYRDAYRLSAFIVLAFSVVILLFIKEPKDKTIPEKKAKTTSNWDGLEYDQLKKRNYFLLCAIMILCNGLCLESITHTGIAHMTDIGIDADFVANIATVASLVLTGAKVLIGIVYDKKGLRFTLLGCHILMVISFILILFANNTPFGRFSGMGALVLSRLAQPLETVMIPLICADLFGSKAMLGALGIFTAMKSIGSCIDAPLCNLVFDLTGTYIPVYIGFGLLTMAVAVGFQMVIKTVYKEKKQLIANQE